MSGKSWYRCAGAALAGAAMASAWAFVEVPGQAAHGPACSPVFAERGAPAPRLDADCGLPAASARELVQALEAGLRGAGLDSNRRAAFAHAANSIMAAVAASADPQAMHRLAPLLVALATRARASPGLDFVALARRWGERYWRLRHDTSVTRTSDPRELEVDHAIASLDFDTAARLLAGQIAEPGQDPPLLAARRHTAATVEWLRFAPDRALVYAKGAYAAQPANIEAAATYADMLDEESAYEQAQPVYEALLSRYQRLAHDNPARWRAAIARTSARLGRLYAALQLPQDAEMAYLRALAHFWALARTDPPTYAPAVATTFESLALLYRDAQRPGDAIDLYREALNLERALAQRDPRAYEASVAATLNDLGVLYEAVRLNDDAKRAYEEALGIQRRLVSGSPALYRPVLARTLGNLGNVYSAAGDRAAAYGAYSEALSLRRQLAAESFMLNGADLARTLANFGALERAQAHPERAQRAYREALGIFRRLARREPAAYRADEARTLNNLGVLLSRTHRARGAETAYREAIARYEVLARADPAAHGQDYARVLGNLSRLYRETGRAREADAVARRAAQLLAAGQVR